MQLLQPNIIEYLYKDEDAYDKYIEGLNRIFFSFMTKSAALFDVKTEQNSNTTFDNLNDLEKLTTEIISKIPEEGKVKFKEKLSELIENYNNNVIDTALKGMTPEEVAQFQKDLDQELQELDNIEILLNNSKQEVLQDIQKSPTPNPEPRPAPTISLTPED